MCGERSRPLPWLRAAGGSRRFGDCRVPFQPSTTAPYLSLLLGASDFVQRVSTDTAEAQTSRLLPVAPPDAQYSAPNLYPTGVPHDVLHDHVLLPFPYLLHPRAPITTDIGRTSEALPLLPPRAAASTLAPLSPSRCRALDSVLPYVAQHNVGSHMSHPPRKASCPRTSLGSRRRLHLTGSGPSTILRSNQPPCISPSHSFSLPPPQGTPPPPLS